MANPNLTNASILDQIRLAGTNDYQQRIPSSTQATIQQIQKSLMDPMNNMLWNEFVSNLFTLIGTQIIRSKTWVNPLAKFKRAPLYRKQTLQEIGFQLMKAKGFDVAAQSLFDVNAPEIKVAYHSMNRQDRYDVTLNTEMLENAFLVEGGLANFVSGALAAQITSDNNDEYQIMLDLIAKYNANFKFYNVQVADISSDSATQDQIKLFLEKVRALTGRWKFLSSDYNYYGIPTFTNPENTLLMTTPEVIAKIDVNVLAGAFNVSMAEIQNKVIIVDHIPIDNCFAVLMDEDWFVCGDNLYQTSTFFNPQTLSTQYYLHHWETIGASPFMNAAIFTTADSTNIPTVTFAPTGFDFGIFNPDGSEADAIVSGETVLKGALAGTVSPENPNVSTLFVPTVFTVTELSKLVAESASAAVTGTGVTGATVVAATFGAQVEEVSGSYEFTYDTDHWVHGEATVTLATYGITATGTPADGDKITVTYVAASTTVIPLNSRTYVDRLGVLYLQAAAKVTGIRVTISAESTYNKDGVAGATNYSKVESFTVK